MVPQGVQELELAEGDTPEPNVRIIGEQQVVDAASRLTANTDDEARQLIELYGADPARVDVVHPGVDLDVFSPHPTTRDRGSVRVEAGIGHEEFVLLFVAPWTSPAVTKWYNIRLEFQKARV